MKIRGSKKSLMVLMIIALTALALAPATSSARDADSDGYDTRDTPPDCNDRDPDIHPYATELCDGSDNNCDGTVDEGCSLDVDTDEDGLLDSTEQTGVTLQSGLTLVYSDGTTANQIPPCDGSLPREKCIKWDSPDVFLIVKRNSSSNLATPPYGASRADPLATLRTFTNSAGNPVVPHELSEGRNTDRRIEDDAYAIRVTEQNDTDLGPLGFAPAGLSPNSTLPGAGEVDIYTERIRSEANKLCIQSYTFCDRKGICTVATPDICQTEGGIPVEMKMNSSPNIGPILDAYVANVLAHEAWHAIKLAPSESPEVTLHHYNPDSGYLEEQSIGLQAKRAKDGTVTVTLYVSDTFHPDSKAYYKLKE